MSLRKGVTSLFDYPEYYDLATGTTSTIEYRFLERCFQKHARRPVRRVFEPACGSGRLLVKFAANGFDVSGCDLNQRAVDYCNARLTRRRLPATACIGDIEHVRLARGADAAFNMISSFQHLRTERAAERHLRGMASSLAAGGLYVIGVQLLPLKGKRIASERWSARRGTVSVVSRVWTKEIRMRRREEICRMVSDIVTCRARLRITEEFSLRTYTARQMDALLAKVRDFEVAATYDFGYDIRHPIVVDESTQDAVYVLRRR